jgi:four helix bundle protein
MTKKREYDLEKRLIQFASMIIDVIEGLPDNRIFNHLADQLLRSGTSPALNYGEAQAAESKRDFIHKLKVILKELRESSINLQLLALRKVVSNDLALQESRELIAIFVTSIKTASKGK